jgi:hypothetical protein
MMIGMNAVSTLLFYLFYHPPSFAMKHDPNRKWEFIKNFDYFGVFVFALGLMLMLMGLSWGGVMYPWKSAHVIATMAIGGLLLIFFFLFEKFAKLKEPFLPTHIFRNRGWFVTMLLWGFGSGMYYANAIIWPSMVAVLYAPGHGWLRNGFLASVPGSAIILGEFTSAALRRSTHIQLRILFPLIAVVLACKISTLTLQRMPQNQITDTSNRHDDEHYRFYVAFYRIDLYCFIPHRLGRNDSIKYHQVRSPHPVALM